MTMERWLRLLGGALILASVILSQLHSQNWLIVAGFFAFSLFQSGFTNWCPLMLILRLFGVKDGK
ncbi:MAG: DUF2892 domain-containing protein [Nitrospirae bacterium]|nr:DUF2892 domain-containing protein [Nitrospirota bacterium]